MTSTPLEVPIAQAGAGGHGSGVVVSALPAPDTHQPHHAIPGPTTFLTRAELDARFTSGHEHTFERAVKYATKLLGDRDQAQDYYQAVILTLWTKWEQGGAQTDFPKDDAHFSAVVFQAIDWKIADDRAKLATIGTTTRSGQLSPETRLADTFVELTPQVEDEETILDEGYGRQELYDSEAPREFIDDTPHQADLARLVWTTIASALSPEAQRVMRVWCEQNYKRGPTAEALGMPFTRLDNFLKNSRETLRQELIKVKPSHLLPDSPWFEVIRGKAMEYDAWLANVRLEKLDRKERADGEAVLAERRQ